MTTLNDESATTILVSCKQTRFDIKNPVYSELDIEGLSVTVAASNAKGVKAKSKARAEGNELITSADLKLKSGVCYALIGRNGTGKSTLLKAIAQKLIPGIPIQTRISLLQQTATEANDVEQQKTASKLSVLEEIIDRATSKNEIQHEIDLLTKGIEHVSINNAPLRALRQVKHERLERKLFECDKDARLRSGARGMAARKALIAQEKIVAESAALLEQADSDITPEAQKEETAQASDMLAELQSQLEPARLASIETEARSILTGLGFSKETVEKPVNTLSGGWRMRTNLAATLLQPTDILILDEPTNFLDLLGIIWLQRYLLKLQDDSTNPTTIVIVSHDRSFINTICQELIILRDQTLTYHKGDLASYTKATYLKKQYLTKMKEAQDKQKAHIQSTIQQSIKAGKASGDDNKLKQAKTRQKKLDERWGMERGLKGGRFKLNRDLGGYHLTNREEIEIQADERGVSITLPSAPDLRFPGPLLSLENVSFKYPVSAGKKPPSSQPQPFVVQEVNLTIHQGDRIGILGLNGSGKSTLLNILTDQLKPTRGTLTKHPRLRLGYYSQHSVEDLQSLGITQPELTALSLLLTEATPTLDEPAIRGLLGSLGLPGRTASDVPLSKLSGGQLVRLALARLLWQKPQLLILDEITTHLDFYTVTALADALDEWDGSVLLVSHDRWMVRAVVEGERDEEEGSEDGSADEGVGVERRRVVYGLKGGVLKGLEKGVEGFEATLERRVNKMMGS